MIAKIRTENGIYNSIVFAIFNKGRESEAIVFNQDYTALQSVKFWSRKFFSYKRNIYIYNCEKDDAWVSNNKVEGYDWVLDNATNKFNKLVVNDAILDRCKEMQSTVRVNSIYVSIPRGAVIYYLSLKEMWKPICSKTLGIFRWETTIL